MAGLARSIRFVVGVSMVAAGSTLASPLVMRLAATWCGSQAEQPAWPHVAGPGIGQQAASAGGQPLAAVGASPVIRGEDLLPPRAACGMAGPSQPQFAGPGFTGVAEHAAAVGDVGESMTAVSMEPLRPGYRPPSPPDPLPPQPLEFAQPGPALGQAYRSTLDVPPPQLLDAQRPPPLAVAAAVQDASRTTSERVGVATASVPATYRVRDGDDLAGIAARFYGQPGVAAAVWAANRETIPDPSLLRIGAELRLPPPWSVGLGHGAIGAGPAIEPADQGLPTSVSPTAPAVPAAVHPWLAAASAVAVSMPPSPATGPATVPTTIRPASSHPATTARERMPRVVRVGPGESLATIAQRFYGDPAMAPRIWEANRGRLRSPELVVPGMELTLP